MQQRIRTECVLVFRRVYDAPIERIWRAWTEASELGRWYLAGDDYVIHAAEVDLRVGGVWRVSFGSPGKPPYVETNRYTEIKRPFRLAWEGVLEVDGRQIPGGAGSTVELFDLGDGRTALVLTNTGDEDLWRHGEGWIPCLNSLERLLAAALPASA